MTIMNDKPFHIFLLMGQSNMSGVAALLPGDDIPCLGVYVLPTRYSGELTWLPAAHPLHNRREADRFGLALSFCEYYMNDNPGCQIGLIPLAWGGAEISAMSKGTEVFADAIKKAQFANKFGVLKGILWHQGESDAGEEQLTVDYPGKLHQLIDDLRKGLGNHRLPFIAGDLGEFFGTAVEHSTADYVDRIRRVRDALRALPKNKSDTAFVSSSGLQGCDGVHFDRDAYIELGRRYQQVLKTLLTESRQEDEVLSGLLV